MEEIEDLKCQNLTELTRFGTVVNGSDGDNHGG